MTARRLSLPPWRSLGVLCLALVLATGARAGVFPLVPHLPVQAPLRDLTILEDPTGVMPPTSVFDGSRDASFHPLPSGRTSLGVSKSTWWIRFQAVNSTAEPVTWVFNVPFPMVDHVDFYVRTPGQPVLSYQLGDKQPLASRPVPGEGFAIPVTTPPGQTTTLYVRLSNVLGDGLDAYAEVSSLRAYFQRQFNISLFLGLILGGGLVLFLYNSVICLVVRDSLYVWYLLYLGFALLTFVAASGLGSAFLWSHRGYTSEAIPPLASSLAFYFVVQFSRRFLNTPSAFPRIDHFLLTLSFYFFLPPIAFFTGHGDFAARLIMVGSIALTALPFLGAYVWLSGQRTALIFTLAWGVWFAAIGSMSSRILGLTPTNDFTLRLGWVGILGEAILFALALAVRIRLLRHEKAAAEVREHDALRRSKDELELLVRQRTQELASRHDELRRLNRDKDKLFSIVAHDLRNPFYGVVGLSQVLSADIHQMSRQEIDDTLRDLRQSAETFHKLLENLLSWALLQLGGVKFTPEPLDFPALAARCLGLFAPAAQEKGVQLSARDLDLPPFRADPQMLETILRNLLSNAIKYSRPGGQVTLSARSTPAGPEISVADQGVGLEPERAARLFDFGERSSLPGTGGERGTGLGLQLCCELVELHGGRLTVESRPGLGATFRFTLPQPPPGSPVA